MSLPTPPSSEAAAPCWNVFCYGSLRPDDDSGMPWTEEAVAGMRAQPATVTGAKLYDDKYATLVFDDDAEKRNNNDSKVVGWVLTTHSPRLFAQKLKQFDFIEGYNEGDPDSSFYQRRIVDVRLGASEIQIKHVMGKPSVKKGPWSRPLSTTRRTATRRSGSNVVIG